MPDSRARIIQFKIPSMRERKRRRTSIYNSEALVRSVRFLRYCVVCSASIIRAVAPWGLAMAEAATMLLLYFVAVPHALLVRQSLSAYRYSFASCLEDVVALSLLRAAAVTAAYFSGAGGKRHRPYMYTAYAFAIVGGPAVLAKLLAFEYPHHSAPVVLLLLLSLAFTGLHITAAHNVVRWARYRADMGLDGFGYPWEEGEEAWIMMGRTSGSGPCGGGGGSPRDEWGADVSPRELADPDSNFVEVGSLSVHFKEAIPPAGQGSSDTGIVLIHGYGSGAFAWRNIMWQLAALCRCRVVAFDRPAFGLTSRPRPPDRGDSPYSMRSAARLALALAGTLGLKRVVFVGHADGALVALLATAMAAHPATAGGRPLPGCDKINADSSPNSRGLTELALKSGGGRWHRRTDSSASGATDIESGQPLLPVSTPPRLQRQPSGASLQRLPSNASQQQQHTQPAAALLLQQQQAQLDRQQLQSRQQSQSLHPQQQQQHPQGEHRDADAIRDAIVPDDIVASAPTTLAPSGSAAGLKLRSGGPPSMSTAATAGGSATGSGSSGQLNGRPCRTDSISTVATSSSAGKSSGGTAGSPLTVLVVSNPGGDPSDSATVSEDYGDDCIYSPMLSPRQRYAAMAAGFSSAEDLTVDSPGNGVTSDEPFASPVEQRVVSPSEGPADVWRGLLMDDHAGGHYFDTGAAPPEALGLALLHPNMAGSVGPSFTRLLAGSKLGRRMLRPLLRSELGEVSNRRAWHEASLLTAEVLQHYKQPLRARNWDTALLEVSRLPREVSERQLAALCGAAARLPTAVATGAHDRLSPPARAATLAADLGSGSPAVLPACGHLSHEETPEALLRFLSAFVSRCLREAASGSGQAALQYSGG